MPNGGRPRPAPVRKSVIYGRTESVRDGMIDPSDEERPFSSLYIGQGPDSRLHGRVDEAGRRSSRSINSYKDIQDGVAVAVSFEILPQFFSYSGDWVLYVVAVKASKQTWIEMLQFGDVSFSGLDWSEDVVSMGD